MRKTTNRKITKFRRSIKAVSPVIAVLLMIVIAVASALFAYSWVMGYLDFLTVKVDQSVQIQSIARDGSTINAYAMNIGTSPVELQNVYVNDKLDPNAIIEDPELDPGETTKITSTIYDGGTQVTVKVATAEGNIFTLKKTFTGKSDFTLTITVNGPGQVETDIPPPYAPGTSVQLTAVPDELGWSFSGWSGDLTGTDNPATVTLTTSMTITATFTQNEYTLTTNTAGSGTVTKNPDQPTYHYGDTVQLTATPDTYWHFSGWSGDLSGSTNPTDIIIDGHKTVTATFTENSAQTLTRRPDGRGNVDNLRNSDGTSDSNNWKFVDESSTDGHSTYVYDQDQGDHSSADVDTYNIQNHGSASGRINSVTVRVRCIKYGTDSDSSYARTAIRVGSTVYVGNRNTLGGSWTVYSTTYPTKPAGGSWTWSDIDSLQAGVRLASGDTSGGYSSLSIARCTQVWIEVNYTPP